MARLVKPRHCSPSRNVCRPLHHHPLSSHSLSHLRKQVNDFSQWVHVAAGQTRLQRAIVLQVRRTIARLVQHQHGEGDVPKDVAQVCLSPPPSPSPFIFFACCDVHVNSCYIVNAHIMFTCASLLPVRVCDMSSCTRWCSLTQTNSKWKLFYFSVNRFIHKRSDRRGRRWRGGS